MPRGICFFNAFYIYLTVFLRYLNSIHTWLATQKTGWQRKWPFQQLRTSKLSVLREGICHIPSVQLKSCLLRQLKLAAGRVKVGLQSPHICMKLFAMLTIRMRMTKTTTTKMRIGRKVQVGRQLLIRVFKCYCVFSLNSFVLCSKFLDYFCLYADQNSGWMKAFFICNI